MQTDNYVYEQPLSADQFIESDDLVIERVPTPEIKPGSFVFVRSISAADRGDIEAGGARFKEKMQRGKEDPFARDYTVRFAWLCMCNQDGSRMYDNIADVARLKKKNAAVIARIAQKGQELSGLSKEDMEKLEKNSETTQPEDSRSD